METIQIIFTILLFLIFAEVSYLVIKLPRQSGARKQYIFLDTSVLIDGRIVEIAASGFMTGTLAIPRSVIGELQYIADNADAEKRLRARHGLDVARSLQDMKGLNVVLFQDGSKAPEGVDERLISLAKKHAGAICTLDYNLNKVASVEDIRVCNVNELAKNLRMAYLPGERAMVEIVQKGQDNHQGVGYLSDGTMVVVEQASSAIGRTVEVEFIRSLQTAAGKMMFARTADVTANNVPQRNHDLARKPVGKKVVQKKYTQKKSKISPNVQTKQSREETLIDLIDKQ
jgi:uncharacterized protein YacL